MKLIAVIRRDFEIEGVALGVYPALVPMREVIARTDGVYNGISVTGDVLGTTVLTGRGAGQDPTASSVISDIVEVLYKSTDEYSPESERGIIWNDQSLTITWPVAEPIVSAKDQALPTLATADNEF